MNNYKEINSFIKFFQLKLEDFQDDKSTTTSYTVKKKPKLGNY